MFRRRNSKERKGDEIRNSIQIRSSLIPKLRPRPTTAKTEVPNPVATSVRKNSINTNTIKPISGRLTRKSVQSNNNSTNNSTTSVISRKKSVLPIPPKLSLIPKRSTVRLQVKAPPKDISNIASSSSSTNKTATKTAATTTSNTSTKSSLPGFLRPTASSLAKSRKRPSLTLVKASPTPTKNLIKKARRENPNPKKKMESRKEKRETFGTSTVFGLEHLSEEDEEDVPLKKNDHHNYNSDTDSCPTTTVDDDNNPSTTEGAMDVEDLRRDVTINEESFAQKCLIEIHSTPKCTTDVHSGLSLARRALLRQGRKVHPTTILNDASSKQNAKINYSFGMDSDDDDALVPDCEGYEIFSTPIRNFSTSVSSPPNSASDNDDDTNESIYFTPCGEI